MTSPKQTPKRFWLPDLFALAFAALVVVWALREHAPAAFVLTLAVVAFAFLRNRKRGFGVAIPSSGLSVAVAAAIFAGPVVIVLVAIVHRDIAPATTLAVIAAYAVILMLGRQVRRRGPL